MSNVKTRPALAINIGMVLGKIRKRAKTLKTPMITMMAAMGQDPFRILMATVLSLRTKDQVTAASAERLFQQADSPKKMALLTEQIIQTLIYPVGFYRQKAHQIKEISSILLDKFAGKVPDDLESLLSLPGVGRKTANLVLSKGYSQPAICVDTHVHRISNRLGFVKTKNPEETEMVLRKKLSVKYWIEYNDLLVAYGQSICVPISPFCSKCVVKELCPMVGVKRSR